MHSRRIVDAWKFLMQREVQITGKDRLVERKYFREWWKEYIIEDVRVSSRNGRRNATSAQELNHKPGLPLTVLRIYLAVV